MPRLYNKRRAIALCFLLLLVGQLFFFQQVPMKVGHNTVLETNDVSKEIPIPLEKTEPQFFPNVHIFYYQWYSNLEHDTEYNHWNHRILPHW